MERHAELKEPEEERQERLIEFGPPELHERWHRALMVADQTLRERSRVVKLAERVIVEDEGAERCREGLEGGLLWRRWWNR